MLTSPPRIFVISLEKIIIKNLKYNLTFLIILPGDVGKWQNPYPYNSFRP